MAEVTWLMRGDLLAIYNFLEGRSRGGGADLSLLSRDRTQGNGMKQLQGKYRLDIREKFFTVGVVSHWNRLPGILVTSPSPSDFKKCLDDAFSMQFTFRKSCEDQGAGLMILMYPFQVEIFYNSVILRNLNLV